VALFGKGEGGEQAADAGADNDDTGAGGSVHVL
jgi:hypothetical protein